MDGGFWGGYVWPGIIIILQILAIVVPLIVAVAYLTYAERKVLGAMQLRQGPMVVGPWGLLQPIADGIKMIGNKAISNTDGRIARRKTRNKINHGNISRQDISRIVVRLFDISRFLPNHNLT